MKTKIHFASTFLGLFLAASFLSGCHMEEPIVAELGEPEYVIKDGEDYITSTIYDLYKDSGTKVIYSFNPLNANWNVGRSSITSAFYLPFYESEEHSEEDNMRVIEKNLRYLKSYFFDPYSTVFKSKNFPVHIFLCDTITKLGSELIANVSQDHMALNLYRDGDVIKKKYETEAAYFMDFAPQAHAKLWEYIFTYRYSVPQLFSELNEYAYKTNIAQYRIDEVVDEDGKTYEHIRKDLFDIKAYGFWSYDVEFAAKWAHTWSIEEDIADFVNRMVMYSEAENMAEMEGYAILKNKFDAIRAEIKEMSGMDLQTIGDAYASYRKEMEALITPAE